MPTLTKLVLDPAAIVAAALTANINVLSLDETGAPIALVTPTLMTDDGAVGEIQSYAAGVAVLHGIAIGVTRVWLTKSGVVSNKLLLSVPNTTLGPAAFSAVANPR